MEFLILKYSSNKSRKERRFAYFLVEDKSASFIALGPEREYVMRLLHQADAQQMQSCSLSLVILD